MELPFQTAESQSLLWWTLLQPTKPHTNGEHALRAGCGCCCVMMMGSALYLLQNQILAMASNNIFRPTQGVSLNHGLGWECPSALSWSLCPPHAQHSLINPLLSLGCEKIGAPTKRYICSHQCRKYQSRGWEHCGLRNQAAPELL